MRLFRLHEPVPALMECKSPPPVENTSYFKSNVSTIGVSLVLNPPCLIVCVTGSFQLTVSSKTNCVFGLLPLSISIPAVG